MAMQSVLPALPACAASTTSLCCQHYQPVLPALPACAASSTSLCCQHCGHAVCAASTMDMQSACLWTCSLCCQHYGHAVYAASIMDMQSVLPALPACAASTVDMQSVLPELWTCSLCCQHCGHAFCAASTMDMQSVLHYGLQSVVPALPACAASTMDMQSLLHYGVAVCGASTTNLCCQHYSGLTALGPVHRYATPRSDWSSTNQLIR